MGCGLLQFGMKKIIIYFCHEIRSEKSLYITHSITTAFFGSEIKYLFHYQIKKDINDEKINNFLFNGYKSIYHDNDTFFRGIKELPSGTLLKIKDNNIHKIKKYFGYRKYK